MTDNGVTQILLGDYLDDRLDEGLEILRKRNPGLAFDREQLLRLSVGYGLERIFRQHERRATRLPGWYNKVYPFGTEDVMIVENLSCGGAGFRTADESSIRVNDVLRIRFILGDAQSSMIHKSVIVKYVNGRYVGVLFCEPDARVEAFLKR